MGRGGSNLLYENKLAKQESMDQLEWDVHSSLVEKILVNTGFEVKPEDRVKVLTSLNHLIDAVNTPQRKQQLLDTLNSNDFYKKVILRSKKKNTLARPEVENLSRFTFNNRQLLSEQQKDSFNNYLTALISISEFVYLNKEDKLLNYNFNRLIQNKIIAPVEGLVVVVPGHDKRVVYSHLLYENTLFKLCNIASGNAAVVDHSRYHSRNVINQKNTLQLTCKKCLNAAKKPNAPFKREAITNSSLRQHLAKSTLEYLDTFKTTSDFMSLIASERVNHLASLMSASQQIDFTVAKELLTNPDFYLENQRLQADKVPYSGWSEEYTQIKRQQSNLYKQHNEWLYNHSQVTEPIQLFPELVAKGKLMEAEILGL